MSRFSLDDLGADDDFPQSGDRLQILSAEEYEALWGFPRFTQSDRDLFFALTAPVGPEYSCSLRKIDMVKAVNGRQFNNVAGFRCSYGTTVRRVSIQGLVCSPRMVVIQIRRHKFLEMLLVEHDDVVKQFSA